MRFILAVLLLIPLIPLVASAQTGVNSDPGYITSLEIRESGVHSVHFDIALPNPGGCTWNDRAVLDTAKRDLYGAALMADATNKLVVLQVSGCQPLDVGSQATAPELHKIRTFTPPPAQ